MMLKILTQQCLFEDTGCLWQYYRDEPALDNNNNVIIFPDNNNNTTSFKFKKQIIGQIGNGGTKNVEIMIPLKYLSNFWRKTEISLINCKICLQSKWSKNFVLLASTAANQNLEFRITETSLYFPFVTL